MTDGNQTRVLIVVPCLNEAKHLPKLLEWLAAAATRLDAMVVVVDGGSDDGTVQIAQRFCLAEPRIRLLDNPARIQSAAVNLAVDRFGKRTAYIIRIDAHGEYPADFCDELIADAQTTGADSVVVPMRTKGLAPVQVANAAVQNSKLGTGGSKHRLRSSGEWIDHGHHALFRTAAFLDVGGYDETFTHNEDAELDHRLSKRGFRIWLSGRTEMTYFPRPTFWGLAKQYHAYGRGRAKNLLKHGTVPKLRQAAPLLVFPAVLLAAGSALSWLAAMPAFAWMTVCLLFGVWLAASERKPELALTAFSAMIMHFAWSAGFWRYLVWPDRKLPQAEHTP